MERITEHGLRGIPCGESTAADLLMIDWYVLTIGRDLVASADYSPLGHLLVIDACRIGRIAP